MSSLDSCYLLWLAATHHKVPNAPPLEPKSTLPAGPLLAHAGNGDRLTCVGTGEGLHAHLSANVVLSHKLLTVTTTSGQTTKLANCQPGQKGAN